MAEKSANPRKEYYSDWYQANKKRISEKRKAAYKSQPGYKEKVLGQSAQHRERQRSANPRVKIPRHQVPKKYKTGDGGEVVLYSIGFFSMFISRSVQSINEWEKSGILPKTPYIQGSRKFRFYTQAMMDAVREMVGTKRRLYPVDPQMFEKLTAEWVAAGVPVNCEEFDSALRQTNSKRNDEYLEKIKIRDEQREAEREEAIRLEEEKKESTG